MRLQAWALAAGLLVVGGRAQALGWPDASGKIEKALSAADPGVRRNAAFGLSALPRASLRRLLPKVLDDTDPEVKLLAAELVTEQRLVGIGAKVIPWLTDADPRIRIAGARLLALSPEARATAALGRGLSDPEPNARAAMAEALGASGGAEAVPALLGRLDDSVPAVREVIVRALGNLRSTSAVVPLIGKIQDVQPSVRVQVVRALGAIGDVSAASALILALSDRESEVRIETLAALGKLRAEIAVPAIVALSRSAVTTTEQARAVGALAEIRTPDSVRALVQNLELNLDPEVLAALEEAFAALATLAVPELENCLAGHPARPLADYCVSMLGQTAVADTAALVLTALRQGISSLAPALRTLGRLKHAGSLPTALEFLTHEDPAVRLAAIDAARALLDPRRPDGRALEPVRRALAAPHLELSERVQLVALLGLTGARRAAPLAAELARATGAAELRVTALEALGRLGPADQDGVLLDALDDEVASVRLAAALALRRVGSAAAAPDLLRRLARSAEQDRAALQLALGGPLSRATDRKLASQLLAVIEHAHGGMRDALIEGLGRMAGRVGADGLRRLARSGLAPAERAKIAEALANHPEARDLLRRLAQDPNAAVRANAIWGLASAGDASDVALLSTALRDRDVSVAGNAVAALALVAARTRSAPNAKWCAALSDSRPYVRANGVAGLRYLRFTCPNLSELELLRDPSEIVRTRAAALLSDKAQVPAVAQALRRCVEQDRVGAVSAACAHSPAVARTPVTDVTVFVVPVGQAEPVARAPFALLRADGFMRLGLADQRGAVFEWAAPAGEVTLVVPAPLAE